MDCGGLRMPEMMFEHFRVPKLRFWIKNTGFSARKPGRESSKPGRRAPVAHTATLIGPTCILEPGDEMRWVSGFPSEALSFF